MIFDHILDAIKAVGVEKAVSVGQPFDPSRHEAMLQRTEPEQENGVVLEEFQPCYLLGGEVVRPARVIVNKLPDAAAAEEPQTPDADASEDIDETTDIEPEVQ